jgi:hypothetical protein
MFLPRLIRQIWQDIQSLGKWYKQEADALNVGRILLSIIVVILASAGLILFWSAPVNITVSLLVMLLAAAGYVAVTLWRIRLPQLEVGELMADDSGPSCCFQIKLTNRGPGPVKPTVTITRLTDESGKSLPNVPESIQATEVHWRGAQEKDYHPDINKGIPAFAGVFEVQDKNSVTPYLCTYPCLTNEPRRLWNEPIALKDQKALHLSLLISYRSSQDVKTYERHYRITPDRDAPLNYRIERVKRFAN